MPLEKTKQYTITQGFAITAASDTTDKLTNSFGCITASIILTCGVKNMYIVS